MGVPKFFRYISERYPCLSEVIQEHQISDFDNLYLDMNGIIHMCSHPDDSNPHFRITEEKIFSEIFHYISYLFKLIRPKKVFYMAVDGVAPRAKMNQQRGRRFRTAKEAVDLENKAKEKGEKLPEGKRFDSNCITPGTVFMVRLHEQLRYFVKQKISTDSQWAKCRVVLSGHETPGEGEHKIMEYIRYLKTQPDHDPNTRHCLYGLDADLIMLGLCIHEPNFSLLREEVKFGKHAQRANTPDENNFFLLHLSLLKDYLEQEFWSIKAQLSFPYDFERIVDDWVLMGFLVGNDFIPPLPQLHIHQNALPLIYEAYKRVIVNLDGYINEGGILNLPRFEKFMKELSNLDRQNFQETYADIKYFESKTGRSMNAQERKSYKNHVPDDNETFGDFGLMDAAMEWNPNTEDLKKLIQETKDMVYPELEDEDNDADNRGESDDDDTMFNREFKLHRDDYYKTKLECENVTPEILKLQAECYVRAIQWVLHYYYQGCVSWSWFYPHHYAPFITDIVDFNNMDMKFDMGTPFKPFEQLLAVLPAASKELLPEPFHHLMTDGNSPILSYYPENFKTDLNGKRNEWEAVVLIPFIDETHLLGAMEPLYKVLTEEELKRNTHGPMLIYDYTPQDLGECVAPEYFPTISSCYARETPVFRSELDVHPDKVVRGPLPNPNRGVFYPGIPTLRTLPFTSHFTKAQVKVFEHPSRNENCILRIEHKTEEEPSIERIAEKLLGKVIWVGWPHLHKAKVQSVSNDTFRIRYTPEKQCSSMEDDQIKFVIKDNNATSKISEFEIDKRTIIDHHSRRLGIEVGDLNVIVHAVSLKGLTHAFGTDGTIIRNVDWCTVPSPYPIQTVIPELNVAPIYTTRNLNVQDALPKGDKVFVKVNPYYGCLAEIVDSSSYKQQGRVKINVFDEPEPRAMAVSESSRSNLYMTPNNAAARCGVSTILFSRLTGCIFVSRTDNPEDRSNNVNIGLNIKHNKKNEEVAGYTQRKDMKWLYSQKCVDLLIEYKQKFPDVFHRLSVKIDLDRFIEKDFFPNEEDKGKLTEVSEWLKNHSYKKSSVTSCGSQYLEPEEVVELKDWIVSQQPILKQNCKIVVVQVKPHVLFKPDLHQGTMPPDPAASSFKLYHRVVNVNSRSTVPLGLKGIIVGISELKTQTESVNLSDKLNQEPVYNILFDKPFVGGISNDGINETRMFKMQGYSLLNITQGRGCELIKAVENIRLNSNRNHTNVTDTFRNLRNGDGRNSAFANYSSPTKNNINNQPANPPFSCPPPPQVMQPQMPKPVQAQNYVPPASDAQSDLLKSLLNISPNSMPMTPPSLPRPFTNPPFLPNNVWMPPAPITPTDTHWQYNSQYQQPRNNQPQVYHNNPPFNSSQKPVNVPPNMYPYASPMSQTFINSNQPQPPRDLKLPFPNKLMDNQGLSMLDNSGMVQMPGPISRPGQPAGKSTIPSQFIPLQAVRPRYSAPPFAGNKPYRKSQGEKNSFSADNTEMRKVESQIMPSAAPPQVAQVPSSGSQALPAQVKKRRSRIAATFANPGS